MGSRESIESYLAQENPTLIFNAAAYTAVDRAESEPAVANAINGDAPGVLADWTASTGAQLIHFSTDYVFDGYKRTPYVESDEVGPLNEYGRSKLAGERNVVSRDERAVIMRTSWVYGSRGANFLLTMLKLARTRPELRIVDDQVGAPTAASAIAEAAVRVADLLGASNSGSETRGVYHLTAAGSTTWAGFANAIFSYLPGKRPVVIPITTAEYPTPARRPAFSLLDNTKLKKDFDIQLPDWQTQLESVARDVTWE